MRTIAPLFLTLVGFCLILLSPAGGGAVSAEEGYGSVQGKFVLQGNVPKLPPRVAKGAQVKDANVCAANAVPDDSLVVDPESRGIQNIFIYLRRVDEVHPTLEDVPEDKQNLVSDQKGCRYVPHAMFVRVQQSVLVKSNDNCSHNTHTYPIRNQAQNFILQPNNREGVPVKFAVSEILPMKVGCDIHPWMGAWWLVLDHPYAAVTGEDGSFKIEKLPVGQYEFVVWHERTGYLGDKYKLYPAGVASRRGFQVTISDTEPADIKEIKVPAEVFLEEE